MALTANINSTLTPGASDTYVYTDANGNNQTATVNYGSYTWRTNFNCNDQNMPQGLQLYLVSSVSLPDGTSFALAYEQTPGYAGNGQHGQYTTGRVASMTLPTGGSISYGYSGGNNGLDCPTPATGSWVVPTLTRTVKDNNGHTNTWTYVNSNNSENPGVYTVTIQDPSNNNTVYTFDGQYQVEKQVYEGAINSQNLLDTEITCYNNNFTSCSSPSNAPILPITQSETCIVILEAPRHRHWLRRNTTPMETFRR